MGIIRFILQSIKLLVNKMGSLEELFVRQEFEGNTTYTEIVDWLTGPKRSKSSYRNVAIILAEPFGIRNRAEKLGETFEEADDWRELRKEVDLLGLKEPKTRRIVQTKLDIVEELETKEVERQEVERAEEGYREFIIEEYREVETIEEEKEQRRRLKEELPYSYRSIKGWQTRRGKEAFRNIFG